MALELRLWCLLVGGGKTQYTALMAYSFQFVSIFLKKEKIFLQAQRFQQLLVLILHRYAFKSWASLHQEDTIHRSLLITMSSCGEVTSEDTPDNRKLIKKNKKTCNSLIYEGDSDGKGVCDILSC